MPGEAHVLTTSAGPALLDDVHALLDALWAAAPAVPAADRMAFTTAVAELAANVVEHASAGRPVPVTVELSEHAGLLAARIEDGGVPLPALAEREVDPLDEAGRGLHMVRALSDEVAYDRVDGTNRWRVTRRCRG